MMAFDTLYTFRFKPLGMKTKRKQMKLSAIKFVFIFFYSGGNEYRNLINEYGNEYYRKRTRSEYKADTKTKVGGDRNLKPP